MASCSVVRWKGSSVHSEPADQNKFGVAVAEQWQAVVGQRVQAPLWACAQVTAAAWTETAATGRLPQEDKAAEIAFLPQNRAKASVRPLVPAVAKVAGPCQFGSLRERSTRDAKSHSRKRVREIHQLEPPSKPPQLSLRRVLVRFGESI